MLQLRTKGTASGCPRTCRARTFRRHEVVCVAGTVPASATPFRVVLLQRVLVQIFNRRGSGESSGESEETEMGRTNAARIWLPWIRLYSFRNTAHAQRPSPAV